MVCAMMVVILSVFLYSIRVCSAGDQGDFDVCVSVRQRDSPRVNNINSTSQVNRPGKMGPRGPRGFKGDVGPPGECVCDQQRLDGMQTEIDRLKELYSSLKPAPTTPNVNRNPEACYVGLKDGRIPDSALSASKSIHGPRFARLDTNQAAWVAGGEQVGQWIQVDLGVPTTITGIITQGRKHFTQWITSFRISYGLSTTSLRFIQDDQERDKIFVGNDDRNTHKTNLFVPPRTGRYFRLYVVTYHTFASLRMEYLKC